MPTRLEELDADLRVAFGRGAGLRRGISSHAWVQDRYQRVRKKFNGALALEWLAQQMCDYAIHCYKLDIGQRSYAFESFSDGRVRYLYEVKSDRVLLVWGKSAGGDRAERDEKYHAGFPSAREGFDKAHLWAHAQGGAEGGPNYIFQARKLNRGWSENGKLWRAIERYLAANPRTEAFVRLGWSPENDWNTRPREIEYCLVPADGQIRSCVFPNED